MNFYEQFIKPDPRFLSTKRIADLNLLAPFFYVKVQAILVEAKVRGLDLMVFETYRSQQRQEQLFRQGATKLRKVGVHHFGLAADIVKLIDGEPSWKGSFALLGELARVHGLIWGGDWGTPNVKHTFIDGVHVQGVTVAEQAKLFDGTWYPKETT